MFHFTRQYPHLPTHPSPSFASLSSFFQTTHESDSQQHRKFFYERSCTTTIPKSDQNILRIDQEAKCRHLRCFGLTIPPRFQLMYPVYMTLHEKPPPSILSTCLTRHPSPHTTMKINDQTNVMLSGSAHVHATTREQTSTPRTSNLLLQSYPTFPGGVGDMFSCLRQETFSARPKTPKHAFCCSSASSYYEPLIPCPSLHPVNIHAIAPPLYAVIGTLSVPFPST